MSHVSWCVFRYVIALGYRKKWNAIHFTGISVPQLKSRTVPVLNNKHVGFLMRNTLHLETVLSLRSDLVCNVNFLSYDIKVEMVNSNNNMHCCIRLQVEQNKLFSATSLPTLKADNQPSFVTIKFAEYLTWQCLNNGANHLMWQISPFKALQPITLLHLPQTPWVIGEGWPPSQECGDVSMLSYILELDMLMSALVEYLGYAIESLVVYAVKL